MSVHPTQHVKETKAGTKTTGRLSLGQWLVCLFWTTVETRHTNRMNVRNMVCYLRYKVTQTHFIFKKKECLLTWSSSSVHRMFTKSTILIFTWLYTRPRCYDKDVSISEIQKTLFILIIWKINYFIVIKKSTSFNSSVWCMTT